MRKKALLAIAFAGGLISPLPPAIAKETIKHKSAVEQFATSTMNFPEQHAYRLLELAMRCLDGADCASVEAEFDGRANQKGMSWVEDSFERYIITIAEQQASKAKAGATRIRPDENNLANSAIKEALNQIGKSKLFYPRLSFTFIAACLYHRLGNIAGEQECNKLLDAAVREAETMSSLSAAQARATLALQDFRAFAIIPLSIPNHPRFQLEEPKIGKPTEADFKAAERIKLQGVAIADKLQASEHVRRKAHRDLALWYEGLGRRQLAEKEKLALYKLVGFQDEKVLTPQIVGCGDLLWWQKEASNMTYDCGRG